MSVRGYTTVAAVNALLGDSLTSAQEIQCADLLEGVEATIDRITGQAWLLPVPDPLAATVTDELIRPDGTHVYLSKAPVTSIEEIRGRRLGSVSVQVLDADDDYYVVSLERGLLYLPAGRYYDYLLADYTPTAALPAEIGYAAARIAAYRLGYTLSGSLASGAASGSASSVRSLSIGGKVSVTYGGGTTAASSTVAVQAAQQDVPEDVMGILLAHRGVVFA